MTNNKTWIFCSALFLLFAGGPAVADKGDDHEKGGNNECPVGLLNGKTLDEEFGYSADGQTSTSDITRCLKRRHKVKLLMQANKFCSDSVPNSDCTRPYALGNITNIIKDYEITHGMERGKDYRIAVIVHDSGGNLLLDRASNQFRGKVKELLAQGVKFYFCQNTARGMMSRGILTPGNATAEIIPGVEYVTAGISALGDFQSSGWTYVQP